jgi:hypothetical protein
VPTASIDFTLAAFAMIVVVVGAIFGANMAAGPYLGGAVQDQERYDQLGRHMLLSRGDPIDWGIAGLPTSLGFASGGGAYELDIDKVTRLNPSNAYSVNYTILWEALGVDDVSFVIVVEPLFDLALNQTSTQHNPDNATYTFSATTTREGYPVQAELSCYIAIRNSTYSTSGSTDVNGLGSVQFTLPNSKNGAALLVVIARTTESVVSYGVLPFAHNSSAPRPSGAYATLSPRNHVLEIELSLSATAWNAAVFTMDYCFNLTSAGAGYAIPYLQDSGPMILALTGFNASDCWAEWVAYPQVPLEVGADMSDEYVASDMALASYLVEVNGALYRFNIGFRSPAKYE